LRAARFDALLSRATEKPAAFVGASNRNVPRAVSDYAARGLKERNRRW
jgi:hypothetical protein